MIGFIGTGNMASAMIGGIINSGARKAQEILVSDASAKALENLEEKYPGVQLFSSNIELTQKSKILILSVKPHIYGPVIEEIRDHIHKDTIIVTIAAGVTLSRMAKLLNPHGDEDPFKVIRTMPNTPALVGQGMTALCPNDNVSKEELNQVESLFQCFGKTQQLPEAQINAFTSLCGSSPAWIFTAIEAMADGAVLQGLPRQQAYTMAAQAVYGSALMVLETGQHPGVLKDQVCSPGGTTIEAMAELEERGFRSSWIEAIRVCTEKARLLSGE